MNSTQAFALAYLMVSVGAFTWQVGSTLVLLRGDRLDQRRRVGLMRTLAFRSIASAMYVGVALVTLITDSFPIVGLAVFALTQLIWLVNSWLDIR